MKLYVYGPALGLTSTDAECVAAIALLSRTLKPDEWTLIISHTAPETLCGDLPILEHDQALIRGYRAIGKYLGKVYDIGDHLNLDEDEEPIAVGISHHIQNRSPPLVDTHFYTNTYNYVKATGPFLARALPFPINWSLPSRRYDRAKFRTSHLGLQATTTLSPTLSNDASPAQPELDSTSPSLLFARGRATQASLQKQAQTAYFKLEGAVDALCQPLDELLAKRTDQKADDQQEEDDKCTSLFGGKQPVDADFLAYGHLSLLLFAEVPDRTVEDIIRKRWKTVVGYAERLRALFADSLPAVYDDEKTDNRGRGGKEDREQAPQATPRPSCSAQPPPSRLHRSQLLLSHILTLFIPPKTQHRLLSLFLHPSPPLLTILLGSSIIGATVLTSAFQILVLGKDKNLPQAVHVFRSAAQNLSLGLGPGGGMGEAGRILREGFRP